MWLSTRKQPTFLHATYEWYMLLWDNSLGLELIAARSSPQLTELPAQLSSCLRWLCFSAWNTFCFPFCFWLFIFFFYTLGSPSANPAATCCLPLKVTAPLADGPWARTSLSSSHRAFHEQSSKASQHRPAAMNGPLLLHGKMSWPKGPDLWTWWSFSPPHPQRSTYCALRPVVAAGCLSAQLLQHTGLVVEDYQNAVLTRPAISLNTLAQGTSLLLLLHHFSSTF